MSIEYATVKYVTNRAKMRIEDLHLRLEAPGLDVDTTNLIRGQIQEVRCSIEDVVYAYETAGSAGHYDKGAIDL